MESRSPDVIFTPLRFRNLQVKNRVLRSNLAGRFGNYDGSGGRVRARWEESFAEQGIGAIVSSFVPVLMRGRILPNYETIDCDERIPMWRRIIDRVHRHDCKYILQLSHSGRQRDVEGVDNLDKIALSSTDRADPFHGIQCRAMSQREIDEVVTAFGEGARRAKEAGADGVELHGANGYLITQFLSSAINDRTDGYGGGIRQRARFVIEIVRAIRARVGDDFHLQMKISAEDHDNVINPFAARGNVLEDTLEVCQMLEREGVDAFHVSSGSLFPHPLNPPGGFPLEYVRNSYPVMLGGGTQTFRNYAFFHFPLLRPAFRALWDRMKKGRPVEGINADYARRIKAEVKVPVLCTGGFQRASEVRMHLENGHFDAVTIARSLLANRDLALRWQRGEDAPERPCTYCNKCLVYAPAFPLGCYEESRFDGDYDRMMRKVFEVFADEEDAPRARLPKLPVLSEERPRTDASAVDARKQARS